jgi:hypothetical protein
LKDYLAFFGSKENVEELCMRIIYQEAGYLHRELAEFAENKLHLVDGSEWHEKHAHVACTSEPDVDYETDTKTD